MPSREDLEAYTFLQVIKPFVPLLLRRVILFRERDQLYFLQLTFLITRKLWRDSGANNVTKQKIGQTDIKSISKLRALKATVRLQLLYEIIGFLAIRC